MQRALPLPPLAAPRATPPAPAAQQQQQQASSSLARSVRPIPITVLTVSKGGSKGAELMAKEWADKLRRWVARCIACTHMHCYSEATHSRLALVPSLAWAGMAMHAPLTSASGLALYSCSGAPALLQVYGADGAADKAQSKKCKGNGGGGAA